MKEADILIRNCIILPTVSGEVIKEGIIATKNDKIIYAGKKSKAPRVKAEKIIDGHGKVAIPGLINCHTHLT